jgi:hypothetical protein
LLFPGDHPPRPEAGEHFRAGNYGLLDLALLPIRTLKDETHGPPNIHGAGAHRRRQQV